MKSKLQDTLITCANKLEPGKMKTHPHLMKRNMLQLSLGHTNGMRNRTLLSPFQTYVLPFHQLFPPSKTKEVSMLG